MFNGIMSTRMAFPGLLLLLTVMSIVGRGMLQIIVVLGITGGSVGSRTVRGAVIDIKENTCFHALWPGLCLTVVVYSLNMFGDALRDLLDPRLHGGAGRLDARGSSPG